MDTVWTQDRCIGIESGYGMDLPWIETGIVFNLGLSLWSNPCQCLAAINHTTLLFALVAPPGDVT